ncbi:poly(ADP-ribose) glycohydrolase-like [Euwallacea fornicatus]|uniref:poly(ADP-ribose) glycohydrolase-like n=1 Tax=Euwallacea fornicatus TaxID=995702 RepID=UPI00338F2C65
MEESNTQPNIALHNVDSETETINWKGTSIEDICKGKGPWSFAVRAVLPSKYHSVLCELPVTLQNPPKPHKSKNAFLWDEDHVRMPHSDKNLFCVLENGSDVIKERWKLIYKALSVPITTSDELEHALNKYNSALPKLEALHYFLNEDMATDQSVHFFNSLLPKIITLALKLPELFPNGIPLLKRDLNRSLSMSQEQISCILANSFLCTFPWKKNMSKTYPGVNFVSLFAASGIPNRKQSVCEKLKSICNYFRRVTQNVPLGLVTFQRKIIPRSSMPRWDTLDNNLGNTKVHITSEGTIEDNGLGFLQVDFANKNIGGGVLRYGCVQEEIRFVICPELIVSRLFVEQLGNGEAVIVTGAERYNNYTGYGDSFEWTGDHEDNTPFDPYGRRRITICVIDATHFNKPRDQFHPSSMLRELNKAYVGFSTKETVNLAPVATGNWGCGAFMGSKQLKTLIQLMACNASNRDLVYFSFGDKELMHNFYNLHLFLGQNQITIVQLWRYLCQFATRSLDENKLYLFIQQSYFDSKKQPTLSHYFSISKSSASKKKIAPSPQKSPKKGRVEEAMEIVDDSPSQSSSTLSDDIVSSSQPESPTIVRKFSRVKPEKPKINIEEKLPKTDIGEIFDMLDGNMNNSEYCSSQRKVDSAINGTDVFSVIDQFAVQERKIMDVEQL